jgi:hypothetical protein
MVYQKIVASRTAPNFWFNRRRVTPVCKAGTVPDLEIIELVNTVITR